MRNLQKILALVLALIMSFSLVATAGAFSDDGDISDAYKDAVTVLNGLEVFKGYDNGATFQPKGNITRAEVAAIIYRIATGDVKDTQASIYSTYGQFTDVLDGSWYAGYVNYCANAGYIKGRGNKIFDPQATVTGYEALAMILRAVGYDKNGEFTGSNWQIRTASIANERGISKNVTSAMLGQAATREVVAELLFRSIIIPKVNFNANTLSYTEKPLNADGKKDTLGYESLKLEEITGIVTANEYADLEKSITLNDGKTRMRVDGVDGQDYILDYTEENLLDGLDAIGEEHNAYIQNANTTSAKVLVMAKTDNNKTYETLEEVEIDTDSKFREKTGFQRSASATEDFLNFDEVNEWHSDWRIKYVVSSVDSVVRGDVETQIKRINTLTNFELPSTLGAELATPLTFANGYRLIQDGTTDKYFIEYTKEFRIDEVINSIHRGNIEEIFNIADKLHANDYVRGEVYVGTSSLKDISDEISFKQFVEQYIDTTEAKVTKNENGNWLKVIDNDNDGQAEYVLKIVYTMAQVVRAKDGKYGLDTEDVVLCNSKKGADDAVNFIDDDDVRSEDTLALDDIVYYAVIDDKAWATKAEIANVKIDVVNRKDLKVTTTDGTEYVESGVCEEIVSNDYNSGVTNMNGSATYDIYLDRGGFLAAFTDSNGGDFTLIVDGWYNNTKNGVEYAVRAYNDETNRQDMIDVTRGGSMFIGDVQWDKHNVQNNAWNALKWLGGVTAAKANDGALDNNPAGQLNGESGIQANEDVKTTVATLTGDGMLLPVDYASTGTARTDKVVRMLAPKNNAIPTSAASYNAEVYRTSDSLGITDTAYDAADGTAELRALSSTTYYLVYPSGNAESGFVVERYVGYANVPSIDDGFVEDVYAVGTRQNRVSTLGADSYFTANVVVVELNANYRGKQEQVFIYNMPEAGSRVGIESVDLIRENGNTETVKVDFEKSTIRDYRPAWDANVGWTGSWAPGLYFLYTTGTEGLYTVQPMTPADIAANDYVVGWSATAQGTLKNDYVSVVAFDNTNTAYGLVEKAAAGNKIFTLDYNSRGIADLGTYAATDGNIQRYLGERADETTERNSAREHTPFDGHGCTTYWNQNRVLIHYDGDDAVYAISFKSTNNLANAVFNASKPSAAVWQGTSSRDDAISYANFMVDTVEKVGLDNAVFPTYGIGKADLEALRDTLNNVRKVDDPAIEALIARIDAIIGGVIPPIDEFSVQVIAADGTDITATAAVVTDETDTSATVTLTIPEGQEIDTATLNGAAVAVTAGVNSITGLTKDVEDKLVVTLKDSSVVPAEFTLTFDEKLKEGTFDVTVNGELAADGAGIKTGDIIVLNPAAVLTATGIDETGAVTGDVTVSIKDGFTYSSMFGGWMGVNDAGDLITVPYDPTVAAAGMRARAAGDTTETLPEGPVDTTEEGWFGKVVRDYGATYTITVGNVVWEGKIAQGGTTWKLKQGSVEEAKAAIANIDDADVEKTAMATEDHTVTLSLTTSMSVTGNNYKTTENGTAVFEVKAKGADNKNSILVAGEVEGATVTIEKTGTETGTPSDTWYTWTVTVSDVTADVTVPLSINAGDVTVKTSENSNLTATLLGGGLKVGDVPTTTTQIQLAVSDAEMWSLPTTITSVTNGTNPLTLNTDYTYDNKTGVITIKAGVKFQAVVTIMADAQAAQDTYTVTTTGRGATVSPAAVKKGEALGSVTVTVGTGFNPVTSVADIASLQIGSDIYTGNDLTARIDSVSDGTINFRSSVTVTGNVVIALTTTDNDSTTVTGSTLTVSSVKVGGVEVTKNANGVFVVPQKTALKDIEVTVAAAADMVVDGVTGVTADANNVAYDVVKNGNTATVTFTGAQTLAGITTLTITGTEASAPTAITALTVNVSNIGVVDIEDTRTGNSDSKKYALVSGVADIESIVAGWDGNTTEADAAQGISGTFVDATGLNSGVVGTATMSLTADMVRQIAGWNGIYRLVCVTVDANSPAKVTAAGVSEPINLSYLVDGNTVTLTEDITVPAASDAGAKVYEVSSGDITIDLDGHTINVADGGAVVSQSAVFSITSSGKLTVKNGTINGNKGVRSIFRVESGSSASEYALTLEDVNALNDPTGTGWNPDESAVYVFGPSKVKINRGSLSSSQCALSINGANVTDATIVEADGTSITGGVLVSCNNANKGAIKLKNCTVSTEQTYGVRISGGTLQLEGTTIRNNSKNPAASAIVFGLGGGQLNTGDLKMDDLSRLEGVNRQIGVVKLNAEGYKFESTSNIGTWKVTDITGTAPVEGLSIEVNGPTGWEPGYNVAEGITVTEPGSPSPDVSSDPVEP